MNKLVVIGVGSPYAEDDLAWKIIDALKRRTFARPGWMVELIKSDRPGVGLLELLKKGDAVVLIDAMSSGARPGMVRHLARHELRSLCGSLSSHDLGVAETLALGERLQLLPPRLQLIGVELTDKPSVAMIDRISTMIANA